MNDRFKFRVWYKLYNGYVKKCDQLVLLPDGILCEYDGIEIDSDNYIIEQCTGLKDNCGNLIYEGDIIGDGEDDYVIKWDNNRTKFVAEDNDISYEVEDILDPTICVIGNIHEQEELYAIVKGWEKELKRKKKEEK